VHSRRKFVAAAESDEFAQVALQQIGKFHALERDLLPLLSPVRMRRRSSRIGSGESNAAWQQRQAEPILAELKKWLEEQRTQTLPKLVLGQAVGYALNNYAALCRYLIRQQ